jgi:thioesterase domain-containing protein
LLESPTIAGLAETISRAKASSPEIQAPRASLPHCLVRIKEGDPNQPLFLVHPAGGHVYNYLALALATNTPHEVYGVQAEFPEDTAAQLDNMEAMGKYYAAEIRKLRPTGPYVLGGASFGGALAYEIAQNLLHAGQQIESLFLIDTAEPEKLPKQEPEDSEVLAYLLKVSVNIADGLDDLKQLLPDEQIAYFLERAKKANKLFPTVSMAEAQLILRHSRINLAALAAYRPRPIACKLTLFLATERGENFLSAGERLWMHLSQPGSTVHHVPGNHVTMNFMPNVQVMGDKLTEILLAAASPHGPAPRLINTKSG